VGANTDRQMHAERTAKNKSVLLAQPQQQTSKAHFVLELIDYVAVDL